jgi:N-acetylglucosamine kinase-like BadF-type ATPase
MRVFLGIDVGSSKTHALLVEETGRCVGFGRSGAGNHQNVGYPGLTRVLCEAFAAACKTAGVEPAAIAGAGFGVAGYDFPSDREEHLRAIASLGLSCPVEVVNDGWNGLYAGATRGIGVNVTAGSSNNCRGRNGHGKEGRIVGNGMMVGEFGGGYEIVARGLHMVNYAWIQRNPPTALTQIYLGAVGAQNEADLLEGLSNGRYQLSHHLARDIIQAAQEGDSAACKVTQWAGAELGWLAVAVARQIDMANEGVEIIQSGSLFGAEELITQPMQEVVLSHCPRATLVRLKGPPVVGAVVLGMERTGFDGYAVRDTIVRTAENILP